TDSVGETTRRIQAGAPPLAHVRPDLPEALRRAVAAALALNPARRPSAAELADRLRAPARRERRREARTAMVPSRRRVLGVAADRVAPAALAAAWAGWTAATLPFYPAGWAAWLAAGCGAVAAASPRAGAATAFCIAFFPLANI